MVGMALYFKFDDPIYYNKDFYFDSPVLQLGEQNFDLA